MLKGINQADPKLISPIQHYGCYFLTLAQASLIVFQGEEGCQRLNGIWVKATELGIISGDINHDGDVDDDGEAEIQNATRLAQEFFGLKVKYDGIHHGADEPIPANVKIVIGQYFSIVATSLLGITSILLNVFKINADLLKSNFYGILLAASIVIGFVFIGSMVISVIFCFLGFYQASKEEDDFKKAMICAVGHYI